MAPEPRTTTAPLGGGGGRTQEERGAPRGSRTSCVTTVAGTPPPLRSVCYNVSAAPLRHKERIHITTYVLPPAFYADHRNRALPEEGVTEVVKETARKVHVRMDAAAYADLLSDSYHYGWNMAVAGYDDIGMIGSAKATHRALVAAGAPA